MITKSMPITDGEITLAYVVPAKEYEELKVIEKEDNDWLVKRAEEAIEWWLASPERNKELNNKAQQLWNLHTQS